MELFADGANLGESAPLARTVTDIDGSYAFRDGLAPNACYVVVVRLDGNDNAAILLGARATTGAEAVPNARAVSLRACTEAAGVSVLDVDFGFAPEIVVGDRVFVDANRNGLQDVGERGIANVPLRLERRNTLRGDAVVVCETRTDSRGIYRFSSAHAACAATLAPSRNNELFAVVVERSAVADHRATISNAGGLDNADSDAIAVNDTWTALVGPIDQFGFTTESIDIGLIAKLEIG